MTLTTPVGGATMGGTAVTTTITDDDSPGTLTFSTASASVAENVGTVLLTATRTGGSVGAVSATVSASGTATGGGTDYTYTPTTVSWAAGDATDKTVTITVVNDALTEASETVIMTLTTPVGGATIGGTAVTTTITDDDSPGTLAFSTASASVAENVGTVVLTATRTGGTAGAVSATVTPTGTATNVTDYSFTPATVSWAAGDATDKTVTITVVDDALSESAETMIMNLTAPTGGATIGGTAVTTTITDNDASGTWTPNTYYLNQAYSGALEGYTDGYATCGTDPAVGATVAMSDALSAPDCTGDRADMAAGGSSGALVMRLVRVTPYTASTPVRGTTITWNLRDYANSGTAATQYSLGCLNGTSFTSFGTVNEFRDTSTSTAWTTDISSLSGTCNAGDSLAIEVRRAGTAQFRFYIEATSQIGVEEYN